MPGIYGIIGDTKNFDIMHQTMLYNSTYKAKYKKMLCTGSARTPDEMVGEFGINLSDPTFWAKGTQYLRSKVDEIEKLA